MDEFSWFIGLLEGEGYIGLHKKKDKKPSPQIIISMSDEDVIERLSNFLNVKYRGLQPSGKNVKGGDYKRQYRITICGPKAYYIINKVFPHMSKRRQERIMEVNESYTPKITCKTPGYTPRPKKPINLPF